LGFVGLSEYADEMAMNLPHGRQRLLGLAVALATKPKLLLLDEPVTGMTAEEVENMLGMIRALWEKKGITCIIIEHNMKAVMGLCDHVAVLNFGTKIAEGTPAEIVKNPAVMEAYLGTEEDVF
jgi:branched-chain amino acid transport system ATP-binding protein